jgi:lysophospholipase L1-like esterase
MRRSRSMQATQAPGVFPARAAAAARGGGGVSGAGGAPTGADHWVGTWTGAPQLTETANLPPASLSSSTLRQVVHVTLGGGQLRVRFSNEFGNGSVTINQAHVAVCKADPVDSSIDTATDRALAFSGVASVTIAAGKAIWSDPVALDLAPLGNLAITVGFGDTPSDVTGHPGSRTTSYQQAGNGNPSAASMTSAQKTDHWYIVSGVDVMAGPSAAGLVVLGDSITDGRGSTTNGNDRWPDQLAVRLKADAATAKIGVMNQGIGGNVLTGSGLGPSASDRYMRDVLAQDGVRWIIVFEGVNDIGDLSSSAATITAVFDRFIAEAHARDLMIFGATITPFAGNSYYSASHESTRQAVNTYIRSGKFDGFIDLDAAVRDTSTPPKLQSAYDSGDGLHLNPAGYRKMAATVDLALFTR